jgi:phospholipid-binding lipoprotein MlaA
MMRALPGSRLLLVMLGLLGAVAGCATPPPASDQVAVQAYREENDPLEPTNRFLYRVNNVLDAYVLRPAAVAYKDVLPDPVRNGIHNALNNLSTPVKLGNDMLEGEPRLAGNSYMRFLINSTVGVFGIFDPATGWGYPDHDNDFGLVFAIWGVPEGPFLFLPLLGPSNPRDAVGRGVGIYADPFGRFGQGAVVTGLQWGRWALNVVDARAQVLGQISAIKRTALDPYATFRSLYRQHREAQIDSIRNFHEHTIPAWYPQPPATTTTP